MLPAPAESSAYQIWITPSVATLTITVTDTGPTAVNDTNTVEEGDADDDGTNNQVSDNLLTNDDQGNDAPSTVTAIQGGTVGVEFTTGLGGKLVVNADGSYTYTAPDSVDNTVEPVQESFDYTITDSDGTTSVKGTVSIQVIGTSDPPVADDDS